MNTPQTDIAMETSSVLKIWHAPKFAELANVSEKTMGAGDAALDAVVGSQS